MEEELEFVYALKRGDKARMEMEKKKLEFPRIHFEEDLEELERARED